MRLPVRRPAAQHTVALAVLLLVLVPTACRRSSSGSGATSSVGATAAVSAMPVPGGTGTLVTPVTTYKEVEGYLSHFACYPVTGNAAVPAQPVTLADQFSDAFAAAKGLQADYLCAPVSKNDGERPDTVTHLLCYRMDSQEVEQTVDVDNQFGANQRLRVRGTRSLCVPTNKSITNEWPRDPGNTPPVDHFKCYSVTQQSPSSHPVKLNDQFEKDAHKTAEQALWLCNPASKKVGGQSRSTPAHSEGHLVCYLLTPDTPTPGVQRALLRNQFGRSNLTVRKTSKVLCLPSTKRVVNSE